MPSRLASHKIPVQSPTLANDRPILPKSKASQRFLWVVRMGWDPENSQKALAHSAFSEKSQQASSSLTAPEDRSTPWAVGVEECVC